MSIAGRNWHAEKDSSLTSRRLKDSKFASPLELFLHCAEKGEKAAQFDFNGDLQLWDYLLAVYEQDLAARLSVHEKLGEAAKRGEVDDETARQRKALLENSFAWRTFADNVS